MDHSAGGARCGRRSVARARFSRRGGCYAILRLTVFLISGNHSEELTPMTVRFASIARLSLMRRGRVMRVPGRRREPRKRARGTAGSSTTRSRPKPPVVEPPAPRGRSPPPKGAVILSTGRTWTPGKRPKVSPPAGRWPTVRWRSFPAPARSRPRARSATCNCTSNGPRLRRRTGKGQDRGNSGIFFMGRYELQILDSYHADTYTDGQAAAIYGQYPPLLNASRPPGQWQSLRRRVPPSALRQRRQLCSSRRGSRVIHNGILVQNNEEILGADSLAQMDPVREARRPRTDQAPGPWPPRAVPQYLAGRTCRNDPPSAQGLERPKPIALEPRKHWTSSSADMPPSRDADAAKFDGQPR